MQKSDYTKIRGEWLHSLFGKIDTPLLADTEASLSALFKRFCVLRAKLGEKPNKETLSGINIILVIISSYFHQGKLEDSSE